MALRSIRPSFSDTSTSASANAPSQSSARSQSTTSESIVSDARLPAMAGERDGKPKVSASSISKRRRVPDSITRNACMNCKKARAKCDGNKPCSRCDTRSETASCVYEVHIKHAKEELMKQITDLRAKDRQSDRIYKALQSDVLAPEILKLIRARESQENIIEWLDRNAPTDHHDYDGYSPLSLNQDMYAGSDHDMSLLPPLYWTNVTRDPAVIQHLFQLYFAWVHPVTTLLSQRHFSDSFDHEINDFCSPLLVNAICALACSLDTEQEHEGVSFEQLGLRFAAAFREQFQPTDKRITTIQATAIMFLVELAHHSPRAASYLKLATDSITEVTALSQINMPSLVCKATIQGIRCLNIEWAQAVFECPVFLDTRSVENATPDDENDLDAKFWYFYRFETDQTPGWPSLLNAVNSEKLKLVNIINDVCVMMYGPSLIKITAKDILEKYARFKAWYDELPAKLVVDLENKSQALPHVVSLLILYNHSVTQLLRPLIDLKDFPSLLVEDVIFTHAQRGLHLLEQHYRKHFTCRYQPILQMFVVSNLCDLVARYYPTKSCSTDKDGSEALIFGLDVLQESYAGGTGFRIASVLCELLRLAPASYSTTITMPKGYDYFGATDKGTKHTYEEYMDACTRAVYFQPLRGVREKFEQHLAQNWLEQSASFGFRRPQPEDRSLRVLEHEPDREANYLMQIKNLLNNS